MPFIGGIGVPEVLIIAVLTSTVALLILVSKVSSIEHQLKKRDTSDS